MELRHLLIKQPVVPPTAQTDGGELVRKGADNVEGLATDGASGAKDGDALYTAPHLATWYTSTKVKTTESSRSRMPP